MTPSAWLFCRKVGVCACPCFCLLVLGGGGCTALPTAHIWPEPRPGALSQRVPDLLLRWPSAGTARLASQPGKAAKQYLIWKEQLVLLSGDQGLECSNVSHEKLFLENVLVTLGKWGLWVLVPVDNYLKIRPEKKSRLS